MKKRSLTRKLFLSVATLALTITCLSTTSYAWFTTNAEASASAVTASTMASADTSLYISANMIDAEEDGYGFKASCTPIAGGVGETAGTGESLTALTLSAAISTADPVLVDLGKAAAATGAYLRFSLWFTVNGATKGNQIEVKTLTLLNTTGTKDHTNGTIPAWYPLVTAGGVQAKTATYVDCLNAARLAVVNFAQTDVTATQSEDDNPTGATVYTLTPTTNPTVPGDATLKGDQGAKDAENKCAVLYYNTVMGEDLDSAAEGVVDITSEDDFAIGDVVATVDAGKMVRTDFYIWLEGWDKDCYDGILGQSISIAMTFQVKAAEEQPGA